MMDYETIEEKLGRWEQSQDHQAKISKKALKTIILFSIQGGILLCSFVVLLITDYDFNFSALGCSCITEEYIL